MGILITCAGIPFYYFGVAWKDKPKKFQEWNRKFYKYLLFKIQN